MQSTLNFTGDVEQDIQQYAVTAALGYTRPSRLSVRGTLGAVLGGTLEGQGRTHDIAPGVIGSVAVAQQWVSDAWFVTGTFGFSASRTTTREGAAAATQALYATDFRLGALAGRTFGAVSPYALARAFAGPVFWTRDAMELGGSDTHFFQLGAGVSVVVADWSFVVDVAALGERAASVGMSKQL